MKFIIYILLLTLLGSCKKFMSIPPPEDKVSTVAVFNDSASATSAIVGLYTVLQTGNIETNITQCTGLCADELGYTSSDATYEAFLTNTITIDNSIVSSTWKTIYQEIYSANLAIEKLNGPVLLDTTYKNQLIGEAEFIRALMNFYLINLWENVPLVTGTDYTVNASLPRISKDKIYNQIITDLGDAYNKLEQAYLSPLEVRPNKWSAAALLARVYLYMGDWINAEKYSGSVINSGIYSLDSLGNVFLKESTETIWQLYPVLPSYNNSTAHFLIPASAHSLPRYPLTDDFNKSFEPGDMRKLSWTDSSIVNGTVYHYAYKYKVRIGSNTVATEYPIMLRLAEQYLIRAEARAQQNNLTGAVEDLNIIRSRAGLMGTLASDQKSMLTAIAQERRIELFAEQGQRWFDLKRTLTINDILGVYKGSLWNATDALWPIPFSELSLNPALVQNDGY